MPAGENRRLEALHKLGLLDTPPDARFDRITRLASAATRAPIALICLVDAHRQWFKSRRGLDLAETPREISFCAHTILQNEPLIVADTLLDGRFADNPLVIGGPHIRCYAGHPIHAPLGECVGTLCVIDTRPRLLSPQQLDALAELAALVDAELLARRFDSVSRAAGVGLYERSMTGDEIWWSDAMWQIFGQDPARFRPTYEECLALVHPEDRSDVRANAGRPGVARAARSLRFRIIRPDGSIRHVQSIAATERHPGSADRIMGVVVDVTDRVEAERREYGQQLRLRESSHQAGMAEVARGVLHSVGNVANSLGITNATIRRNLKALRLEQLDQAATLVHENRATLASFLTDDERGRHLPDYLPALAQKICSDVRAVQAELDTTDALLGHLRDIVSAQHLRAHIGGLRESVNLKEVIDAALCAPVMDVAAIEVVRHYEDCPQLTTDRHKLTLILVILLDNARDAVLASATGSGRISVHLGREADHAVIMVEDSGVGMSAEVLSRLWRFGFTTKSNGQGFDLHNSANAAREIGATITAHSNGTNQGSRFVVRLPILNKDAAATSGVRLTSP
jgi:PAS domain S-box-containing protein